MNDQTSAGREYRIRIPSLFEIFFGKLANWFRQLAKWRKQGLLRKALAALKRRRTLRMEQLEPRLLLSADLTYSSLDTDLTLRAVQDGSDYYFKLFDSTDTEIESIVIDDAGDLDLNIQRSGSDPILEKPLADIFGDSLDLDLDTFDVLDSLFSSGLFSGSDGVLKIRFEGGAGGPLLLDDTLELTGTTQTLDFGLAVFSTADIVFGLDSLTLGGDLLLDSRDAIVIDGASIDTGSNDLTLTVESASEGIFGRGELGLSDASVNLTDAVLTGNNIAIKASSSITLTPESIGGTTVRVAGANAFSGAAVTLSNADLTASGDLSVTARSTVSASADVKPGTDGDTAETTDAAVAETVILSNASVKVQTGSTLQAGGEVDLHADNAVTALTKADARNAGKGASVAVTYVGGDTVAFVDTGSAVDGASVSLAATSTRTVTSIAVSSPGGAADGTDNRSQKALADPDNDGDTADKATTSGGDIQVAGAVAVSVVNSSTEAYLDGTGLLESGGAISIKAASNVTSRAIADGSTTDKSAGTGVGIGVAVNVADVDTSAYLAGNVGLDAPAGITVEAGMTERSLAELGPTVDLAADSIALPVGHGLESGDEVTYGAGTGGTQLGGLTDTGNYFVNVVGGKAKLYDSKEHAQIGGQIGLVDLTGLGAGTAHTLTKTGGGSPVTFDPQATSGVDFDDDKIAVGSAPALKTGDPVVYNHTGASPIGNLIGGTTYYAIVQDDGTIKLAESPTDAAGGTAIDLGAVAPGGTHSFTDASGTHRFIAEAKSGAGAGDVAFAGSLAVMTTKASSPDTAARSCSTADARANCAPARPCTK